MSVQEFFIFLGEVIFRGEAIFREKPFLARSHNPVKSHFVMRGEDLENNFMSKNSSFPGEKLFSGEKPFSGRSHFLGRSHFQGGNLEPLPINLSNLFYPWKQCFPCFWKKCFKTPVLSLKTPANLSCFWNGIIVLQQSTTSWVIYCQSLAFWGSKGDIAENQKCAKMQDLLPSNWKWK